MEQQNDNYHSIQMSRDFSFGSTRIKGEKKMS